MITVLITLTTAGSGTGPFDLYSNTDGYTTALSITGLSGNGTSTVTGNVTINSTNITNGITFNIN